jgi:hypothetical protein
VTPRTQTTATMRRAGFNPRDRATATRDGSQEALVIGGEYPRFNPRTANATGATGADPRIRVEFQLARSRTAMRYGRGSAQGSALPARFNPRDREPRSRRGTHRSSHRPVIRFNPRDRRQRSRRVARPACRSLSASFNPRDRRQRSRWRRNGCQRWGRRSFQPSRDRRQRSRHARSG